MRGYSADMEPAWAPSFYHLSREAHLITPSAPRCLYLSIALAGSSEAWATLGSLCAGSRGNTTASLCKQPATWKRRRKQAKCYVCVCVYVAQCTNCPTVGAEPVGSNSAGRDARHDAASIGCYGDATHDVLCRDPILPSLTRRGMCFE